MEITQNKHKTQSKGHSSEMKKAKAAVIVRDTSSLRDILFYKVSWSYPKGLLCYGAYKNIGGGELLKIKGVLFRN